MKPAFYIFCFKPCFVKDFAVGKKVNAGSGFFGPADNGKQAAFKLENRDSTFVFVLIYVAAFGYANC